ncbi:MAG: hypothetical protein ACYSU4_03215 [Planctomycetota bacterium]
MTLPLPSGTLDVPGTGFLTASHPDDSAAAPIATAAAESFRNARRETCRKGAGGFEVVWGMTVVYARRVMSHIPYRMSWQSVAKLLNIVPSTASTATCLSPVFLPILEEKSLSYQSLDSSK